MFTDELGGNASRRRAEEAKERRKRLKEQQLKKLAAAAASAPSSSTTGSGSSFAAGVAQVVRTSAEHSVTLSSARPVVQLTPPRQNSATTTTTKVQTAVELAAAQRQRRAAQAAQQHAAVKAQAVTRGFVSRSKMRNSVARELEQKLSDMDTLRSILLKKSPSAKIYIFPSAAATALVRQFLFVAATIDSSKKKSVAFSPPSSAAAVFARLLELAVLPGLEAAADGGQNPVAPWIESTVDRVRLRRFLRSLLLHYNQSNASERKSADVILRCLRALVLGTSPLQLHCRALMLRAQAEPSLSDSAQTSRGLDLIASLRHHLLFLHDKPIPADADVKRDACFSATDKIRLGALTLLVLDAVLQPQDTAHSRQLQARFVTELLTIPLFAWRLPANTIAHLMCPFPEPRLITLLQSFTAEHAVLLNDGRIDEILESPDLPMTLCGATGTQRLLANILQLGRLIPSCNGTVACAQDFAVSAGFFDLVSTLVDAVPLGTFLSARESTIAWISVGGNHKPIVLSPIILEQCRALIVESYVRRMFQSAMDTTHLRTDSVLAIKNDKDIKLEKDLNETGNSSAASLAAKEAREDRNKNFWNSSKWARKLGKGVASLLSSETGNDAVTKKSSVNSDAGDELLEAVAAGLLLDTSSISRQLAGGDTNAASKSSAVSTQQRRSDEYSTDLLFALARTYSILLARWGGDGSDDIVSGGSKQVGSSGSLGSGAKATTTQEAWVKSFLNVLCFSTSIVQVAWGLVQSDDAIVADVFSLVDADRGTATIRSLSIQPKFVSPNGRRSDSRSNSNRDGVTVLFIFLCAFSHVLIITDDVEIHGMDRPLPIHQIRRCIQALKKLLYRVTCIDNHSQTESTIEPLQSLSATSPNYFGLALISAASRTMRDLYDRSSRRPICVPDLWIVPSLLENEIGRCKSYKDYQALLSSSPVLRVCPYMVSFKRRLRLFERIITTNRVEIQGENSSNPFHTNPLKPGIPVRISRNRLLEDGISTMNNLGTNMRQRIAVQYYNEAGTRESGIDAGGLFKEFWTDLCAIAFDPNYALFSVTDGGSDGGVGNCLYPNPSSAAAHGADHITLLAFLGRILGKALYEGITIHPKFAHFFLSFLKGDYNFLHMLPDLSTVDSQLYNNLMFLKTYNGNAADLALSFTVTVDNFGGTKEIPLIPNGANIDVTDSNKQLYVGLVAKYYVYDRIRDQSEAMTRGLFEVVDRSWLRLFNEPELQVLISGATDGKLDVDDMKAHCHYAGGYSSIDRTVGKFWKVVVSLTEKQQGALLRFVTSCERPPPLGFGSLNPPFTIHRVGILRDGDRLPTASTCFNVLKLPTYSSEKVLRQRLIYAIESGAGFELT